MPVTTPLTFRTRLAQVLTIVVAVLGVVALVTTAIDGGAVALLTSLAPVALVVALAWAVFWRPRVVVGDDGITLVNVTRTVHVPWSRFRSADTRWALTIETDGARYSSWAVPAGSGFGARMTPRRERTWSPAAGKLGSSGTAEAAALAIGGWVERGTGRPDDGAGVSVTLHVPVIVLVLALAALTAVSLRVG